MTYLCLTRKLLGRSVRPFNLRQPLRAISFRSIETRRRHPLRPFQHAIASFSSEAPVADAVSPNEAEPNVMLLNQLLLPDEQAQEASLQQLVCLTNAKDLNQQTQVQMGRMEALVRIASLLKSPVAGMREQSALLLGNLIVRNKANSEFVVFAGAIPRLMELLNDDSVAAKE